MVVKARGEGLSFTSERAIRHLGWVGWDVEKKAPTVQTARGRLERVLAWIVQGMDKQGMLNLPPLLRRVQKGYRHSGHSAPSEYKVLWEDWGDAFVGRGLSDEGEKCCKRRAELGLSLISLQWEPGRAIVQMPHRSRSSGCGRLPWS